MGWNFTSLLLRYTSPSTRALARVRMLEHIRINYCSIHLTYKTIIILNYIFFLCLLSNTIYIIDTMLSISSYPITIFQGTNLYVFSSMWIFFFCMTCVYILNMQLVWNHTINYSGFCFITYLMKSWIWILIFFKKIILVDRYKIFSLLKLS
jgi:hypothetical protein